MAVTTGQKGNQQSTRGQSDKQPFLGHTAGVARHGMPWHGQRWRCNDVPCQTAMSTLARLQLSLWVTQQAK